MSGEVISKKRVCVTLTKPYLDAVERLIREGLYLSRAEIIKDALRRLFRHYGIEILEVASLPGLDVQNPSSSLAYMCDVH